MNKPITKAKPAFTRADWDADADDDEIRRTKIHNVLQYTKGGREGCAAAQAPQSASSDAPPTRWPAP